VLVIGGASGVGSAAIQIGKQLGARVISTGSTEKRNWPRTSVRTCLTPPTRLAHEVRRSQQTRRGPGHRTRGGEVMLKCFECLAREARSLRAARRRARINSTCGVLREAATARWELRSQSRRPSGHARMGRRRETEAGD
jgi:D-arabinose 1-dehydrogenase-like Zn-dependent alcohol dehydrogenase